MKLLVDIRRDAKRNNKKRIEREMYRFPHNNRAKGASREDQATCVLREAAELYAEASKEWSRLDPLRIAEEAWDVINAAEGSLREIDAETALLAKARVKLKCLRRGDYE